jgi:hypothetical protein
VLEDFASTRRGRGAGVVEGALVFYACNGRIGAFELNGRVGSTGRNVVGASTACGRLYVGRLGSGTNG